MAGRLTLSGLPDLVNWITRFSQVNVELAHGSVTLHQDERTGTLLSAEPCEPIAPVHGLIDLGYKLTRNDIAPVLLQLLPIRRTLARVQVDHHLL